MTVHPPLKPTLATDEVERRLVSIFREAFDLRLGIDDNFFDLAGDSLLAAGIFARIEREFGQALGLDVLFERPTIRLLAESLRNCGTKAIPSSVVRIKAGGSRAPLFCLPGIGGSVLSFRVLAERLGPDQPVYGLPPAGVNDDQPPHRSIGEIAAHAIRQMQSVEPRGPYHLAGFSLGGVVAFEMARQLQSAGERTALLALIDSYLWSPRIELSLSTQLWLRFRALYRSSPRARWSYVRDRWQAATDWTRRRARTPKEVELLARFGQRLSSCKVAEVHLPAWYNYEPGIYDGVITLFVAELNPDHAKYSNGRDATLGWGRWTTRSVEVYRTSKSHEDIVRADELEVMAKLIQRLN